MSQEPTYVGIDVSKERMDVAVRPTGRNWSVSYDEAGVDDLVAQLKDLKPAGVITESTGGLETCPRSSSSSGNSTRCCRQSPPGAGLRQVGQAGWRRLTDWTLRFWRTSAKRCVRRCGPYGTMTRGRSGPCWRAGGR